MYTLKPISDRVAMRRAKYRDTQPEICTERYRLVTEFYMQNHDLTGIIKRAKNFKNICENIPLSIHAGEVIVGGQTPKHRASAVYPENSISWLIDEVKSGLISTRELPLFDF